MSSGRYRVILADVSSGGARRPLRQSCSPSRRGPSGAASYEQPGGNTQVAGGGTFHRLAEEGNRRNPANTCGSNFRDLVSRSETNWNARCRISSRRMGDPAAVRLQPQNGVQLQKARLGLELQDIRDTSG